MCCMDLYPAMLLVWWHQIVTIPLKTEYCLWCLFLVHLTHWDFINGYITGGETILNSMYVRFLTDSLELCVLWNQIQHNYLRQDMEC